MARTVLTPVVPKGPYPGTVAADALDVALAAADNTNGNYFVGTGKELILVQNTAGGAGTFTLTSIADPFGRLGSITTYSLAAGEFAMFWLGALVGWDQGGGQIYLDASAATIKFAIIRIP